MKISRTQNAQGKVRYLPTTYNYILSSVSIFTPCLSSTNVRIVLQGLPENANSGRTRRSRPSGSARFRTASARLRLSLTLPTCGANWRQPIRIVISQYSSWASKLFPSPSPWQPRPRPLVRAPLLDRANAPQSTKTSR